MANINESTINEENIETNAEAEVENKEYKLINPIMIDGKLAEKITYDLEGLTGDDVAIAIKELAKRNIIVTMNEFDQNYHAMVFAIASGLMYEDVTRLRLKDYVKVCNIVRDFFIEE